MLPFLKLNQDASAAGPMDKLERKPDESDDYDVLESAGDDLIAAVHAKDSAGVAAALRAAFQLLDSEPHEEGPHV